MKEAFKDIRIGKSRRHIIKLANDIIEEYRKGGYELTLRALYYRFIARDLFPEDWIDREYNLKMGLDPDTKNTIKNYKALGDILADGRWAGLVDWDALTDETRFIRKIAMWDNPQGILNASADQFRVNPWDNQKYVPELWIEKDAALGVVEPVCRKNRIGCFSCRGYSSLSFLYEEGKRLARVRENGYTPVIIHIGDHDPSGIDMSRDIQERLAIFARGEVKFVRLALNMDWITANSPPPNPAKLSDSRAKAYIDLYGDDSWELDAIEPGEMAGMVDKEVAKYRNMKRWKESLKIEEGYREEIRLVAEHWDESLSAAKRAEEY